MLVSSFGLTLVDRGAAMVERELIVVAHYGWRDWLIQRVTAVVMLLYTLFFLAVLIALPQLDYERWRALWSLSDHALRDDLLRRCARCCTRGSACATSSWIT